MRIQSEIDGLLSSVPYPHMIDVLEGLLGSRALGEGQEAAALSEQIRARWPSEAPALEASGGRPERVYASPAFPCAPVLRLGDVNRYCADAVAVLKSGRLAHIPRLAITGVNDAVIRTLSEQAHLESLSDLELGLHRTLADEPLGRFCQSPVAGQLRRFVVRAHPRLGSRVAMLLGDRRWTSLRVLGVEGIDPESIRILAEKAPPRMDSLECTMAVGIGQNLAAIVGSGLVRRLQRLTLVGYDDPVEGCDEANRGFSELARCAEAAGMRSLVFWRRGPEYVDRVDSLARASFLPALEELDLSGHRLGDAGVAAIAEASPPNLQKLVIRGIGTGSPGLQVMAERLRCRRLEALDMSRNRIADDGVIRLLRSESLSTVRHLHLSECALGDRAAAALAECRALGQLETLSLDGNAIGPDGTEALAASRCLRRLTCLHLDRNPIGRGSRHLLRSRLAGQLRYLSLASCDVSDDDLAESAHYPSDARLRYLGLGFNAISNAGVKGLGASRLLRGLWVLELQYNEAVSDAGVAALASSPTASSLTVMGLEGTAVTPHSVDLLAKATFANRLRKVVTKNLQLARALRDDPRLPLVGLY